MSDTVAGCALAGVTPCRGKLSREHYVSESVLSVLSPDNKLGVVGTHWAPELLSVSKSSLVVRILCEGHNNTLSTLDNTAARLCTFLKRAQLDLEAGLTASQVDVFSGFEFERWLLKVAYGCSAGRVSAKDGKPASTNVDSRLGRLLIEVEAFSDGAGLYVQPPNGEFATQHGEFGFALKTGPNDLLMAAEFSILRLPFSLALGKPGGDWGSYRPRAIELINGVASHTASFDWGTLPTSPPITYLRIRDAQACKSQ